MGIGDWGLGIGDWANPQSPIPNPQSPIPNPQLLKILFKNLLQKLLKFRVLFFSIFRKLEN
jgi:hypothetical protein